MNKLEFVEKQEELAVTIEKKNALFQKVSEENKQVILRIQNVLTELRKNLEIEKTSVYVDKTLKFNINYSNKIILSGGVDIGSFSLILEKSPKKGIVKTYRQYDYQDQKEPLSVIDKIKYENKIDQEIVLLLENTNILEEFNEHVKTSKEMNDLREEIQELERSVSFTYSEYAESLIRTFFDEATEIKDLDINYYDDEFVYLKVYSDEIAITNIQIKKEYNNYYEDDRKTTLTRIKQKLEKALVLNGTVCRSLKEISKLLGIDDNDSYIGSYISANSLEIIDLLESKVEFKNKIEVF